eukprot:m.71118 g.71118  ORF g.71118 m.71118 type:complete len:1682 (+) comp35728_c0_seq1:100-5145(+)
MAILSIWAVLALSNWFPLISAAGTTAPPATDGPTDLGPSGAQNTSEFNMTTDSPGNYNTSHPPTGFNISGLNATDGFNFSIWNDTISHPPPSIGYNKSRDMNLTATYHNASDLKKSNQSIEEGFSQHLKLSLFNITSEYFNTVEGNFTQTFVDKFAGKQPNSTVQVVSSNENGRDLEVTLSLIGMPSAHDIASRLVKETFPAFRVLGLIFGHAQVVDLNQTKPVLAVSQEILLVFPNVTKKSFGIVKSNFTQAFNDLFARKGANSAVQILSTLEKGNSLEMELSLTNIDIYYVIRELTANPKSFQHLGLTVGHVVGIGLKPSPPPSPSTKPPFQTKPPPQTKPPHDTKSPLSTKVPKHDCDLYPFGKSAGDNTLPRSDNGCSDLIKVSIGSFPICGKEHRSVHVCTNGLLSFGKPFYKYHPRIFPGTIFNRDIIAPFWADVDTRRDGAIYYQLYTRRPGSNSKVLSRAMQDVRRLSSRVRSSFKALHVLVATWDDVRNFPDGDAKMKGIYDELSGRGNTFQAVLITDGVDTFVIFGYKAIQWSGRFEKSAVAGYVAGGEGSRCYANLPGSATPDISQLALLDHKSTGERCRSILALNEGVSALNKGKAKAECLDWYLKDQEDLPSEWYRSADPCPCSLQQASRDGRYYKKVTELKVKRNYTCFRSRYPSKGGATETVCCYLGGALVTKPPLAGVASPYHKDYFRDLYQQHTAIPKSLCCSDPRTCHFYFRRRPSVSCSRYKAPTTGWLYGDPHLRTLDGKEYTFNGLGEYVLMKTTAGNSTFVLEGRTGLASNSNATVFTAFAMGEFGSADFAGRAPLAGLIHVELGVNNSFVIMGHLDLGFGQSWVDLTDEFESEESNDTALGVNGTTGNGTQGNDTQSGNGLDFLGTSISKPKKNIVAIFYRSGISVQVSALKGLLAITFASSDLYKGNSRGLLGVWNGDMNDDFTARNNSQISINSTDRGIHYNFGQTWEVADQESLFYYPDGEGPGNYSFPNHSPPFLDEINLSVNDTALITACGGDSSCLFDGIQTGDLEVAAQSRDTQMVNADAARLLANSPPVITGNDTIRAYVNVTSVYEFDVSDPNDTVTVSLTGLLPPASAYNLSRNGSKYHFTWTPSGLTSVDLQFVATDSLGATSLLNPLVRLCPCRLELNATCSDVDETDENIRFVIQSCSCGPGWDGVYCDQNRDGCADIDCFSGVVCIDNPPPFDGAVCGPCPSGTVTLGDTCIDINECTDGSSTCQHKCINKLYSYECDCNEGYTLDENGTTCSDYNECKSQPCHQVCFNFPGGYNCSCNEGFILENNTCSAENSCLMANACQQGCARINGSDVCYCKFGYKLDANGTACNDIDECSKSLPPHNCQQECMNLPGSFNCSCQSGYTLNSDGHSCDDVNECVILNETCPSNHMCINSVGAYTCKCPEGTFSANGSCIALSSPAPPTKASKPTPTTKDLKSTKGAKATESKQIPKATTAANAKPTKAATKPIATKSIATTAVHVPKDPSAFFVRISLKDMTKNTFNASKFKALVAEIMSAYCQKDKESCSRPKRSSPVTADHVFISSLYEVGGYLVVLFYVVGEQRDAPIAAAEVVSAMSTSSASSAFQSAGLQVAAVQFTTPTSGTTIPKGLGLGVIVGIAVGSAGGVAVIAMFSVAYCFWKGASYARGVNSNKADVELKSYRPTVH